MPPVLSSLISRRPTCRRGITEAARDGIASRRAVRRRVGRRLSSLVWLVVSSLLLAAPTCHAVAPAELADDQAELAQKFERLETLAKRIAELTEADDPARAEQLRRAIRKSQDLDLPQRFAAVVELLEQQRLAAAARDQQVLADQLQTLLGMLLEDPNAARIEAERKRLQEALKKLNRQIRTQQQLRGSLPMEDNAQGDGEGEGNADEDNDDLKKLAADQAKLAGEVQRLEAELRGEPGSGEDAGDGQSEPSEGDAESGDASKPGEGQQGDSSPSGEPSGEGSSSQEPSEQLGEKTPAERASDRLQAAEQRMREAIKRLAESDAQGASGEQSAAQLALEDAREEIERALRQLREEEQKQMLTQLATRLRRMLAEQADILKLTMQTDEDRPHRGRRATALAAAGLASRERELVTAADGALRLLREDGKSIAFPEVLSQVRDDMQGVEMRLRKSQLGEVTQRIEQEIIESLEESIESLDKTLEDLEERQQNGQQGAQGGEPGEPPVVDKLAELRMIRTIQARILRRTEFWQELRQSEETNDEQVREALEELARRQLKLMRAVRSLE